MFDELDEVLASERGPDGRPSVCDFLAIDLIAIIDTFSTHFEGLPMLMDGRDDYRVLIGTGALVYAFAVVGQRNPDNSIDIVSIDIDFG